MDGTQTISVEKPHRARARREPKSLRTPVRWTTADTWVFAVIALVTAVSRFTWISHPTDEGTPLFDEKHYVPQAWQILQSTGDPISGGIENNPGFGLIVHPPVAKHVIAIGEWLFGYTPLGWRFMSAVAGVLVVMALMDIVRRLSGSTLAVTIVGMYAVLDGVLFVSSRVGMLDMIQAVFVIGAVWALMLDRDDVVCRLRENRDAGTILDSPIGPYLGWRWWRLAAGILLGLSLGVKWSGLYYIAGLGLWSVFSDLVDRKRAGVDKPVTGALGRDTAPALRDLVLVPLIVYFMSWRSWFAEETSVYRHQNPADRDPGPLGFDWLPEPILNYLHYQRGVLEFHGSLTTSGGHEHPWESKPWEWLVSWRPMLYYSTETQCFGDRDCKGWLMLFGTPPIWWLLVPVMVWAMWRWLVKQDHRYGIAVVGFVVSWVPWAIAYDRQMYFFYATALIPFVLIAFALIASDLARWTVKGRRVGLALVSLHAGLVLASFVFWLPIMTGIPLPEDTFNLRFWLPSWK
ncbi:MULTISPECIES: dolichyl-phosphate-mannose--protein mannosyltransferase [unclassified Corynebacterium]|uniref:dolichyl-phosphate-mannose--protein mannosyltransferase n=1 Tax=unclassified Corynebacterium TaxID=2624378 RepID=UPI0030B07DCF